MKALLLEDDDGKSRRIKDVLNAASKGQIVVDARANVASARESLAEGRYDLLIIDIRVPFRDGEEADDQGGIHLLKEILQDEQHRRPRYVVGISGADDLYERSSQIFHSRGWALLRYSPSSPEWANSLHYFVEHILQVGDTNTHLDVAPRADVVIMTALESPELNGLRNIFPELRGPRSLDPMTLIWEGQILVGERMIRVIAGHCWQMGLTASALLAERLLSKFEPRIIAMTGICAGYEDEVRLGDVIVASQSWEWQGGKIVERDDASQELLFAPESHRPSEELLTAMRIVKTQNQAFEVINKYCPSESGKAWGVHVGPVVSGVSVVASKEAMKEIRTQHRKVIGLEMEAYSIYAASRFSPVNAKCIVMKGVCDFGDAAKGNNFQTAASIRSAAVLRALLESDNVRHLYD